MATHAKDSLTRARITQVLNLLFAIAAPKAAAAERLITGKDREVLNFVAAGAAAVRAAVADKGAVAE